MERSLSFYVSARMFARAAVALIVLVAFVSCADLFTGNLYQNFDGPPDASDVVKGFTDDAGAVKPEKADNFVKEIEEVAESPQFYEDLSNKDREEITTALESVYTSADPTVTTETKQKASVQAAEVSIRGTGAGDTINNVTEVFTSDLGEEAFNDPQELLNLVVPKNAQGDAAKIEKIVNDLVNAAEAYEYLGSSLADDDGDGTVDGPKDTNMTEIAQNAVVAIAVKKLVSDPAIGSSEALAAQVVSGEVTSASLDDFPGDTTDLENILAAGGLDGVFGD